MRPENWALGDGQCLAYRDLEESERENVGRSMTPP